MFGLDAWVASFSDGATLALVCVVAVVLGLRHATDPDHLAAVSTLIAGTRERATGAAARLGLCWGLGHATTLFAFGLPIVLFQSYLPEPAQEAAETTVGLVIVALAVSLLLRWHRGAFHTHHHPTQARALAAAGVRDRPRARDGRQRRRRRPAAGLDPQPGDRGRRARAVRALHRALDGGCSRPASASRSGAGGSAASSRRSRRCSASLSLSFGVWYALGALQVAPYYF